ncbi:hypothetical protein C8Q72DRAFT_45086 [Fomitopsis betulina]|nr:hypothetical protein C8Q72DRAFT_45086 [Fomitopsis betulina]
MSGISVPCLFLIYIPRIGHAQEGDRRDRGYQFPTVICEWKPSLPEPYARVSIRTAVCHDPSARLLYSISPILIRQLNHRPCHGPHVHLPNICPNPSFSNQWPRTPPSLGCARQAPFRTFSSSTRLAPPSLCSVDVISSADFPHYFVLRVSNAPRLRCGHGRRDKRTGGGYLDISVKLAASVNGTPGARSLIQLPLTRCRRHTLRIAKQPPRSNTCQASNLNVVPLHTFNPSPTYRALQKRLSSHVLHGAVRGHDHPLQSALRPPKSKCGGYLMFPWRITR